MFQPVRSKRFAPQVTHDTTYYLKCMLGGVLSCGPTHTAFTPVDVAKCNMQTDPSKYNGLIESLTTIAKEEGLGSVWKGWLPTLLGYSAQVGGFSLCVDCTVIPLPYCRAPIKLIFFFLLSSQLYDNHNMYGISIYACVERGVMSNQNLEVQVFSHHTLYKRLCKNGSTRSDQRFFRFRDVTRVKSRDLLHTLYHGTKPATLLSPPQS